MESFITQRRHRTVSRDKRHIIAQRQQLLFNRLNQLSVVASWKIAASYATFENHIAGNQQTGLVIKEDNMAWRMPRTMQHL